MYVLCKACLCTIYFVWIKKKQKTHTWSSYKVLKVVEQKFWFGSFQDFYDNSTVSFTSFGSQSWNMNHRICFTYHIHTDDQILLIYFELSFAEAWNGNRITVYMYQACTELQINGAIKNNLKIVFLVSHRKHLLCDPSVEPSLREGSN